MTDDVPSRSVHGDGRSLGRHRRSACKSEGRRDLWLARWPTATAVGRRAGETVASSTLPHSTRGHACPNTLPTGTSASPSARRRGRRAGSLRTDIEVQEQRYERQAPDRPLLRRRYAPVVVDRHGLVLIRRGRHSVAPLNGSLSGRAAELRGRPGGPGRDLDSVGAPDPPMLRFAAAGRASGASTLACRGATGWPARARSARRCVAKIARRGDAHHLTTGSSWRRKPEEPRS